MATAVSVKTQPDFTVDQIIRYTGWNVPNQMYLNNMKVALDFFQRKVPKSVLREEDNAGPWNMSINGTKIRLLNWMQGIDFSQPVRDNRSVNKGDPLIAYKDPARAKGRVYGNWFTFPSTRQGKVAIHSTTTSMHKFKAKSVFTCLQSTASDAFVAWLRDLPAEYRQGGATQLFIWDAANVLEPA